VEVEVGIESETTLCWPHDRRCQANTNTKERERSLALRFAAAKAEVGDEAPRRHNNAARTKWNWSVKDGLNDN
ncbi:hypothetical protein M5D96_007003, partial [Drosophila gunungcola]